MAVAVHGVESGRARAGAAARLAETAAAGGHYEPAQADRTGISISIVPVHTAVAGRARLHVAGLRGAPQLATLIERGLTGFGGIHNISASALTGNVTICYAGSTSLDQIISRIAALLRGEIVPTSDEAEPSAQQWHSTDEADVASRLGTSSSQGLSPEEASRRLMRGGANAMPPVRERSELAILLGQFSGLPVALLAGAALGSIAIGGFIEAGAIMAVVALNGGIGFVTERRAERTIRSLESAVVNTARVLRGGGELEIPAEAIVPGDIMVLQCGVVVPADGRLIGVCALTVSEAALTGESLPVTKSVEPLRRSDVALADRVNMVYRGSIVTGGSGTAIVVATGARTEVGRIHRLVHATITPETPLQRQLDTLGEQLAWITLAASGLIFGAGWLRGLALMQLARSSLSVAVAAVPEGLPMVATSTLALGVEEMRRHGIFVRRLEAVETLAAVNVICFDKTGTLTHGSMSLEQIAVGKSVWHRCNGAFVGQDNSPVQLHRDFRLHQLLTVVSLCSETDIEGRGGRSMLSGTATENALVQAALDDGLDVADLRKRFARLSIQHRTETNRFMATTHIAHGGLLRAVKGSPPEVLARCSWELRGDGSREVLTAHRRSEINDFNAGMAAQGLRVLAAAYQEIREPGRRENSGEVERLVWIGLVGLADPVRSRLPELMDKLHSSGIQTIMLTGDQSATARAVGRRIRLSDGEPEVIDAAELDRLSAAELGVVARRVHAFARISPGQKLRVVRALQDSGAVVAMFGDGINDSPALRAADVGIAIGRDGAAAAREVADVFFATEDLAALPVAIERGRTTYENVRRAIHYVLSTNGSEVALMLAGTAAGMGEMLTPMQLLWINLVSDVLPAIGLALEPPDSDVMQRPPKSVNESMLTRDHVGRLGGEAGLIAAGAFGAGLYGALRYGHGSPQARTVTFGGLVTAQLLHALTYQSTHRTAGHHEPKGNSLLPTVIGGSLVAQSVAMLLPGLRNLLGVAAVDILDAVVMIAGGVLPFLVNATRQTERVQKATLHFRSVKAQEFRSAQAGEGKLQAERTSALTRLLQRVARAAPPVAATASLSDTAAAPPVARRLQGSIP
ncbi:MAG TPA: HAD-IC family P-type ATPase [Xanthobacteraceae bacterium]|nr:HAD-IC family P-type ATPase [Xanthobacteraceae bacterium]